MATLILIGSSQTRLSRAPRDDHLSIRRARLERCRDRASATSATVSTFSAGRGRTAHHDDHNAEFACSADLCKGALAAGVAGDHDVDTMVAQDRPTAATIERPAFHDHFGLQRQGRARRIDQPDQIKVLRMVGERRELGAADAEEYPSRGRPQRVDAAAKSSDLDPAIAIRELPGRALQRQQRHAACRASRDRMRAHVRGKGMGGIDHTRSLRCADS